MAQARKKTGSRKPKRAVVGKSTAGAEIAKRIRKMISDGTLLPGEQLRQGDLAERLHVSRIPIREALTSLMSENLIVHHAQRGFFVNKIDMRAFPQLRLVRNVLESAALRDMNWPSEAQLDELAALNRSIYELGKRGNIPAMRELNTEFHQRVLGFSKLQFIVSEVRRLYLFVVLYRSMFVWTDAELERSNTEHLQILSALREHNSEALIKIRNEHANAFDAQVASRIDTSTD